MKERKIMEKKEGIKENILLTAPSTNAKGLGSAPGLAAGDSASQTHRTVTYGDPHFHAGARSVAQHFHARARSRAPHFHSAAAHTYQNYFGASTLKGAGVLHSSLNNKPADTVIITCIRKNYTVHTLACLPISNFFSIKRTYQLHWLPRRTQIFQPPMVNQRNVVCYYILRS